MLYASASGNCDLHASDQGQAALCTWEWALAWLKPESLRYETEIVGGGVISASDVRWQVDSMREIASA